MCATRLIEIISGTSTNNMYTEVFYILKVFLIVIILEKAIGKTILTMVLGDLQYFDNLIELSQFPG